MKYSFFVAFSLTLIFSNAIAAQEHEGKHRPMINVEEVIDDLSALQKSKLDKLQKDSRENIKLMKEQQDQVRDSIRVLMKKPGDNSKKLYPLFDREGNIQAEISKEMYRTRIRIDEILTDEQRVTFKNKMAEHRSKMEQQHQKRQQPQSMCSKKKNTKKQ